MLANALGYTSTVVMPITQSKEKIDALELLGADLNLLAVKQRQLDLYTQLLLDQVNLHNALGGGW